MSIVRTIDTTSALVATLGVAAGGYLVTYGTPEHPRYRIQGQSRIQGELSDERCFEALLKLEPEVLNQALERTRLMLSRLDDEVERAWKRKLEVEKARTRQMRKDRQAQGVTA